MFRLNLPTTDFDEGESSYLSGGDEAANDSGFSTSRSLVDFNDDEPSSESEAGSNGDEEEEEQLDLATMESVFDDATKAAILEYEQQLTAQDEEWLLTNTNTDAESIAVELMEREMRKQKKLYMLRRQKFYELGGRKKTRNIMMRYGITHLKLLKEQHTAADADTDAVETHPRAVANSVMRHLRYGDEVVRIDWFKELFQFLVVKQREEDDTLKFRGGATAGPDVGSTGGATAPSTSAPQSLLASPTSTASPSMLSRTHSRFDGPPSCSGGEIDGVAESGLIFQIPDSLSQPPPTTSTTTAAAAVDTNLAYMKRQRAATAKSRHDAEAVFQIYETQKRAPAGAVDENLFARGLSIFFELLTKFDQDRRRRELRRRRRGSQQQGTAGMAPPGDDEAEELIEKRAFFEDVKASISRGRVVSASSAASSPGSTHFSPDASLRGASSVLDASVDHIMLDDSADGGGVGGGEKTVGGDFLTRGSDIIDAGFRFLFCAVDANDAGFVSWERLIDYLLDATLLTKTSELDLESRAYEFVKDHHTIAFNDLNDACMIPSRDMLVVAGSNVTMVSNRPQSNFAERNSIRTPCDALSGTPIYKVTSMCYMNTAKMLAVAGSDSVVRTYAISGSSKPRFVASAKVSSNVRCMLWYKDLLFVGTREGSVCSFRVTHTKTGGWGLLLVKTSMCHSSIVSRIVAIPTESCIISSSFDKSLVMHDAKSLKRVFTFPREHSQGIVDMCYCDCINGIATVSFDNRIFVWMISLLNNRPIPLIDSVRPHIGTLSSVACVEHARSLVTLDTKGLIKLWALKNFLCTQTISVAHFAHHADAHSKFFRIIVQHAPPSALLPLGSTQLFALSRRGMFVFEYNMSQRQVILRNTADDDPILYVGYNYVEQLYVTFALRSVRVWEAATCAIRETFRDTTLEWYGGISSACLHPNGRAYFLGTHRGVIVAKNFSTGTTIHTIRCHTGASVALRFCYAAVVPATRKRSATDDSNPLENRGEAVQTATKAGLGDVVVSMADDSIFVITASDFKTKLPLEGVEGPRCIDHDAQSSLILVGDSYGTISVFLQVNISAMRNVPFQVLQLPKRIPREITAITVMQGLSAFCAADEEGTIGLFSLKHHPRPFSCIGVWSQVADSMNSCPAITAMTFFHAKWLLYCGDELGFVSIFNIRDAFLLSQKTNVTETAPLTTNTPSMRRGGSSNLAGSPRSMRVGKGLAVSPHQSPRSARGGTSSPRTLSSPLAAFAHGEQRKRGAMLLSESTSVTTVSDTIDFRKVGALVLTVNRFQPHMEMIAHILVISPDNANLGDTALGLGDDVLSHTALLTASFDQCCCGWKLAGTFHLGSLEQYGRCRVPITIPSSADDLRVISTRFQLHQIEARRDLIKLRSRGLLRLASTHIVSLIPERFVLRARQQQQQSPASPTSAAAAACGDGMPLLSARSNASVSLIPPDSARSDMTSSITPRSARVARLLAQNAPTGVELNLHPDVPTRLLMGVQEYSKFVNRRRKSLKQLNDAAAAAHVISKEGIETLNQQSGSGGGGAPLHDADMTSNLGGSEGGESDYNSVLDELFSIASNASHAVHAFSRAPSLSSLKSEASTTASVLVTRVKNLANEMHEHFKPSTSTISRQQAPHWIGTVDESPMSMRSPQKELAITKAMLAAQVNARRSRSLSAAPIHEGRNTSMGDSYDASLMRYETSELLDDDMFLYKSTSTLVVEGVESRAKRKGGSVTPPPHTHQSKSILAGDGVSLSRNGSFANPMSSARSSLSQSSRPPVVVQTTYIATSKTCRETGIPLGRKDRRMGYHTGTLEAYRALAQIQLPDGGKFHHHHHDCKTNEQQQHEVETLTTGGAHEHSGDDTNTRPEPLAAVPLPVSTRLPRTLTRQELEEMLPDTPLRARLIYLLLSYATSIKKDLNVEFSAKRRKEMLAQIIFENKRLRDVDRDGVVLSRIPPHSTRPSSAPLSTTATILYPQSNTLSITQGKPHEDPVAEETLVTAWDEYWDTYTTTMTPPPPMMKSKHTNNTRAAMNLHSAPLTRGGSHPHGAAMTTNNTERLHESNQRDLSTPSFISSVASVLRMGSADQQQQPSSCAVEDIGETFVGEPASAALQRLLRHRISSAPSTKNKHHVSNQAMRGRKELSEFLAQQLHESDERSRLCRTLDTLALVDRVDPTSNAVHVTLPVMPARQPLRAKRGKR